MRAIRILAAGTAFSLASAAVAQDPRLTVPQIGGAPAGEVEPVQQISSGSREIETPVRSESRMPEPPAQLSSGADSARPTPQLTADGQSARQPAQLYSGGRTAQPSQPLSRPSEGRTAAVTPVTGEDRCDAAADENEVEACERVIETRSAEFTRPDPTILSPEQRLLVDQRFREGPSNARMAARRLGAAGTDADSEDSQNIASLVLRPAAPREEEPVAAQETTAAEAAAAAFVNAIINAGSGGNAAPPPD